MKAYFVKRSRTTQLGIQSAQSHSLPSFRNISGSKLDYKFVPRCKEKDRHRIEVGRFSVYFLILAVPDDGDTQTELWHVSRVETVFKLAHPYQEGLL